MACLLKGDQLFFMLALFLIMIVMTTRKVLSKEVIVVPMICINGSILVDPCKGFSGGMSLKVCQLTYVTEGMPADVCLWTYLS